MAQNGSEVKCREQLIVRWRFDFVDPKCSDRNKGNTEESLDQIPPLFTATKPFLIFSEYKNS